VGFDVWDVEYDGILIDFSYQDLWGVGRKIFYKSLEYCSNYYNSLFKLNFWKTVE
jgi:hypothetical protein